MNINATLLVQAGNFYIAYLLFRYILLEMGYAVLQQKAQHQSALEDKVVTETHAIEKERERQKQAWQEFKVWSNGYRPQQVDTILFLKGVSRSAHPKKVSPSEKQAVKEQLVSSLVSTIKERYE